MARSPSLLDHALLGLISQQPSSGYDLRKIFATTPMGIFSDSPGAIYPALARLEAGGLLQGRADEGVSLRRRRVYRLTARGTAELRRWLSAAVTRDDVAGRMEELMLRFAFMEPVRGKEGVRAFLIALEAEIKAYVPQLRALLAGNRAQMATSAWLALESGIRGYEAQLDWCRAARAVYSTSKRRIRP
jgi:DNA-binding PadR family transcriptional regulator